MADSPKRALEHELARALVPVDFAFRIWREHVEELRLIAGLAPLQSITTLGREQIAREEEACHEGAGIGRGELVDGAGVENDHAIVGVYILRQAEGRRDDREDERIECDGD